MAKKSKDTERSTVSVYILFVAGAALLVAAVLMKSFPALIFIALSPLFAITDKAIGKDYWGKSELIGVSLVLGLLASHQFHFDSIVAVLLQGIVFTLAFVAYGFARTSLGPKTGLLPLVVFWLALEYLTLKTFPSSSAFFLADVLDLMTPWTSWNGHTGYLGTSLWLLITNVVAYRTLWKNGFSAGYTVLLVIVISLPIIYSYSRPGEIVTRGDMLGLYQGVKIQNAAYASSGEWIPRTATWVSVLILLYSFVKNKTTKK